MRRVLYRVYAYIFGKKLFFNFNKFLFQLSLRGMGILNHETAYLTGESYWLKKYLKGIKKPTPSPPAPLNNSIYLII